MRIAQLSDIHVLDPRFEERLLDAAIDEINADEPDLVVIAGDLPAAGYREEFEYARERLDGIEAEQVVYVPGNHDARSVGYLHFEDLFGRRAHACTVEAPEGTVQIVCVDSSKPDLDDGEVGRELYGWILDSFSADAALRVFVMHHHLVAIPGTATATRSGTPATCSRSCARWTSTSCSAGTGTSRTSGRWRDCSSSTRAPPRPTGCAGTHIRPTTS